MQLIDSNWVFQLLSFIIINALSSSDFGYVISGKFYLSMYIILFYAIDFLTGDSLLVSILELTILLYFPLLNSGNFFIDYFYYFGFLILKSMSACDFRVLRSLSRYAIIILMFFYSLTLFLRVSWSFNFYKLTIGSSVVNLICLLSFRFIRWVGLTGSTLPGLEPIELWVLFIFLIILLYTSGERVLIISSFAFSFFACF